MSAIVRCFANDIAEIEKNSARYILPSSYYIVSIHLASEVENVCKTILIKPPVDDDSFVQPLCGYTYKEDTYLLFSSTDEEHYKKGDHHLLCSLYSSFATSICGVRATVSIVEFESRQTILAYFHLKIFQNTLRSIKELADGKMSKVDVDSLTVKESIELFEKKTKKPWSSFSPSQKHGVIIKYDEAKKKFISLSEMMDMSYLDKYMNYVFGS
jgi:hypothetical protein